MFKKATLLATLLLFLLVAQTWAAGAGPSPSADWSVSGNQNSALMGHSVASAGDVNNDGYDDVIVGIHLYDHGEENEGAAYLYLGSATGLSRVPAWRAEGNRTGGWFGWVVDGAGDVNGDSYDDIIVAMPNDGSLSTAYIYFGSATGPGATPDWTVSLDPNVPNDMSLAGAGDINGDGYDDVIIGLPDYFGDIWSGVVHAFYGSATGPGTTPDWTQVGDDWYIQFGYEVAAAGDVDGDGYGDVLVGAPQYGINNLSSATGAVYLYRGSATGLSAAPDWTVFSPPTGSNYGDAVAGAGDVNDDGYDDILIGNGDYDAAMGGEGAAFLYFGGASGPGLTADWEYISRQAGSSVGADIASAGDVNDDGYDDVIIGARHFEVQFANEGGALLFLGGPTGLDSAPQWRARGNQGTAYFGVGVNTAGDVDGDGLDEVLVGAYWYTHTKASEGAAFLYKPFD
jgi:hypothetical protein